jgi:uncharacterized repeat protein (TIGR02543 family)
VWDNKNSYDWTFSTGTGNLQTVAAAHEAIIDNPSNLPLPTYACYGNDNGVISKKVPNGSDYPTVDFLGNARVFPTMSGAIDKNSIYFVEYNSNRPSTAANTVTGAMAITTHAKNLESRLRGNAYSLTGYDFDNWAETATGALYQRDSDAVLNLVPVPNTKILYARWQYKETTLSFINNNNGGTGEAGPKTATNGQDMPTPITLPIRDGYDFTGYYDSVAGQVSVQYYKSDGSSARTWNKVALFDTLYAHYQVQTYGITYDTANIPLLGLVNGNLRRNYTYGEKFKLPEASHSNYTFGGFYKEGTYTTKEDSIYITDNENKMFYEKWTYNVVYDLNGGVGASAPGTAIHVYGATSGNSIANMPSVTRTGYHLKGWDTVSTDTAGRFPSIGAAHQPLLPNTSKTATLYAAWAPDRYNVVLDNNCGGCSVSGSNSNVTLLYEHPFSVLPTNPGRPNYTFDGWYTLLSGGDKVENADTLKVTDMTTLYAHWTANGISVKFIYNYLRTPLSDSIYTQSSGLMAGNAAVAPSDPLRTGYDFGNWQESSACGGAAWDFSTILHDNKFLYACWDARSYALTLSGGSGSNPASQYVRVAYGDRMPDSGYASLTGGTKTGLAIPAKQGHTFRGFYYNDPSKLYYDASMVRASGRAWDEDPAVGKDVSSGYYLGSLQALWTPDTIVAVYHGWGNTGVGMGNMPPSVHVYGDGKELTVNNFTRTGYNFSYWERDTLNGDLSTRYDDRSSGLSSYSTNRGQSRDTVHLWAVWEAKRYGLTLNGGKGSNNILGKFTDNSTETTLSVKYDSVTGVLPAAVLNGYIFKEWNANANGSGVDTFPRNGKRYDIDASKTYYAQWLPDSFEMYFKYYNGGAYETDTVRRVIYNEQLDKLKQLPVALRSGYTFLRWWSSRNNTGYANGTAIYNIAGPDSVQAEWRANKYTAYLHCNYGCGRLDSIPAVYDSPLGDTLPSAAGGTQLAVRAGYDFSGWYDTRDGRGTQYRGDAPAWQHAYNDTLYAKWQAQEYTVRLDVVRGYITGSSMRRVKYDDTIKYTSSGLEVLPRPECSGYDFGGWYDADTVLPNGDNVFYDSDTIYRLERDLTLRAKWTARSYQLTLNGGTVLGNDGKFGGTATTQGPVTVTYDSEMKLAFTGDTLPIPELLGYDFSHYNTMANGSGSWYNQGSVYNIVGDTTLYAQWTPKKYQLIFNKTEIPLCTITYIDSAMPIDSTWVPYEVALGQSIGKLPLPKCYDCPGTTYGFGGWYTALLGGDRYSLATVYNRTQPTTLYAHWEPNHKTVTLDYMNDGTDNAMGVRIDATSTPGGSAFTPPTTTDTEFFDWTGHDFTGWYTDTAPGAGEWDATSVVDRDTTLYAKWGVKSYRVQFNGNGGEYVDYTDTLPQRLYYNYVNAMQIDDSVLYGTSLNSWNVNGRYKPFRFGYDFIGYKNTSGDNVYYVQAADNDVLYADWNAHVLQLRFDLGYYSDIPDQYATYDKPVGALPKRTRQGYDFGGWYHIVGTDSMLYEDTTVYRQDSSITLRARWQAQARTITLDGQGGKYYVSGADSVDRKSYVVHYESPFGFGADSAPRRPGYDFMGYYSNRNVDGSCADAGASTGFGYDSASLYMDLTLDTLYAHWCPGKFNITFFASDGLPLPDTIKVGYLDPLPYMPFPTRDGYNFTNKWRTADGADTFWTNKLYNRTSDVDLYAIWEKKKYWVTLVDAGRSPTTYYVEYSYGARVAETNPSNDHSLGGLTFEGWFYGGDPGGTQWNYNSDTVTGPITLTARWTRKNVVGLVLPAEIRLTYGQSLGEASGLECNNCCTEPVSGGRFYFENGTVMPPVADSMTTPYNLVFKPNDSVMYKPSTQEVKVAVYRRPLNITPKTTVLVLKPTDDGGKDLRARRNATVNAYLTGEATTRVIYEPPYVVKDAIEDNTENVFGGFFKINLRQVCPECPDRYAEYKRGTGGFDRDVLATYPDIMCSGCPANYSVKFNPGRLWITQIDFNPADSVEYGGYLPLNAQHTMGERYSKMLDYYSGNPDIIRVYKDGGVWKSEVLGVGYAEIYVTFRGDEDSEPSVPADTVSQTIEATPKRGLGIKIKDVTVVAGRPLPNPYEFEIQGGLVSYDNIDSLYKWGLQVNYYNMGGELLSEAEVKRQIENIEEDGVIRFRIVPCCVNTPKYRNWVYIGDTLTVRAGGHKEQSLNFVEMPPTVNLNQDRVTVWAQAKTLEASDDGLVPIGTSRKVDFQVSAGGRAVVLMDTFKTVGNLSDTIWGAKIALLHAGKVTVTAVQRGDEFRAGYKPVYKDSVLTINKKMQTVNLDNLPLVLSYDCLSMDSRAQATSGLSVKYGVSDTATAYVVEDVICAKTASGKLYVTAYQPGNEDWDSAASTQKELIIYNPQAQLSISVARGGTLSPEFETNNLTYTLSLSCDTLLLRFDYDINSIKASVSASGETAQEVINGVYKMPPASGHAFLSVIVEYADITKEKQTYTLNIEEPLPGEYIYWNQKFSRRLEVVANPVAHPQHSVVNGSINVFVDKGYQWFENGVPIEGKTDGVLYNENGEFKTGTLYSVRAQYADDNTSVWICAKPIETNNATDDGLMVYPNPAGAQLMIKHPAVETLRALSENTAQIYNATTGALITTYHISNTDVAADNSITLDISKLPDQAVYIIEFAGKSNVFVKNK